MNLTRNIDLSGLTVVHNLDEALLVGVLEVVLSFLILFSRGLEHDELLQLGEKLI